MPTPRFLGAAIHASRKSGPGAQNPNAEGAWVPGTVVGSSGSINAVFRVALDGGETVGATSVLDFTITPGAAVYVVKSGGDHVIVGMR